MASTKHINAMPQTLFGYDVIGLVGEGAGSLIYSVSDPVTLQLYALKHVIRKHDKDIRYVEQLEAEHEVASKVRHPGLRRSFDFKINKTMLFKVTDACLIMELVDGRPLEFNIPPTLGGIIDVFIRTAVALDTLHSMGFVHCDLKPNNILVTSEGQVKVIDLGQTCVIGTRKKRIQGTADYMAPEQAKCLAVTTRTDVFNFGATLYWTLTGKKVPTLYNVGRKDNSFLVDDAISTPRQLNPTVPEALSALVMECIRTNPSKRPNDMAQLARRLEVIKHAIKDDTQSQETVVA